MRVTLKIDPSDRKDIEFRDDLVWWLNNVETRNAWMVTTDEIEAKEADDHDQQILTFKFTDHLDAEDFYQSFALDGRGRRR